jgi:hypothetical protein
MSALRARAWAVIATLLVPAAFAGNQLYPVGDDVLIVDIDGNWEELDVTDMDRDAVGFALGNDAMRWLFVPTSNRGNALVKSADLKIHTRDLRREIESQGGDASDELFDLVGSQVEGFYLKGTDPSPGADEYKYMYSGYVLVGGRIPVMFNIVWNGGGVGAANRALAAVRNMRLARN